MTQQFQNNVGPIRQGDVLLYPVPDMPQPAGLPRRQEVILAYGEATGHAHRLRGAEVYEWEDNGNRYVRVAGTRDWEMGTIQHEDHDSIPAAVVVPGVTYQVIHQQEVAWDGEWVRVVD